jgi:hypothetical protein
MQSPSIFNINDTVKQQQQHIHRKFAGFPSILQLQFILDNECI